MAFQYPVEIPGVGNKYFLAGGGQCHPRQHRGIPALGIEEFLALVREKMRFLGIDEDLLNRSVDEGFSGGEKETQ